MYVYKNGLSLKNIYFFNIDLFKTLYQINELYYTIYFNINVKLLYIYL